MFVPLSRPRGALVALGIAAVLAWLAAPSVVRAQGTQPPPLGSAASAPVQPLPSANPPPSALPPPAPAPEWAPAPYAAPPTAQAYPTAEAQAPASTPLYKKWWFWTAIGAFAVTTVVIIAASSSSGPPKTELGNMAAY